MMRDHYSLRVDQSYKKFLNISLVSQFGLHTCFLLVIWVLKRVFHLLV